MTVTPVVISALPLPVNLKLYQGDDFFLNLTVMNPSTTPPTPADLSQSTASAELTASVAPSPSDPNPVPVSVAFTCTIAANVIQLHLPSAESATLPAGKGSWECEIVTAPNGIVQTLAAGTVQIVGELI